MLESDIIATARSCLGTPFQHQGRVAGVGLDCIGLLVIALRAAGIEVRDRTDYGLHPDGVALTDALRAHGGMETATIKAGNILLFRIEQQPRHVGLATSCDSFIHSYAPAGKVVETGLGGGWRRRLISIWKFDETAARQLRIIQKF